ncbi:uncharacterized protein LOC128386479 [Panonychus citri]|uniref:uncharacterized protein LOC128386479 n=1 Tax=Panonychus citri TaxID=50023 RepID=UPI0023078F9A|nr:uncharacterized protein LOC128386479 [Panonychus citri]
MELNLKFYSLCSILCVILIISSSSSQLIESTTSASSEVTICTYSQACGWIVYEQDKPKMMLKNFCTCRNGDHCVKTYHESSNRADVYNCRSSEESTGKERWPTSKFPSTSPGSLKFRDAGRLPIR